jgi:hypothetical protein
MWACAATALARFELGDKLSQREGGESYQVYIPSLKKAEADKKAAELKSLGTADLAVVPDDDPSQFTVSLGVFKTEEAAANYLAQLTQKGVRAVVSRPRGAKTSIFVIRDPGDAKKKKIAGLKTEFPTATLRAAACSAQQSAKSQQSAAAGQKQCVTENGNIFPSHARAARILASIALVERSWINGIECTAPPQLSTSAAPIILSGAQSPPLTNTSGFTSLINASGVSSSNHVTMFTASSAASSAMRSASVLIGRCGPLPRRRTEASLLAATSRLFPSARACAR